MPASSSASTVITNSINLCRYCPRTCHIHQHIRHSVLQRQTRHTNTQQQQQHYNYQHRRSLTTISPRSAPAPQYEPRGLGDFYNDLLSSPLPTVAQRQRQQLPPIIPQDPSTSQSANEVKVEALPDWVASGGRKEIEDRARKLFGSIEGSGYQRSTSETPDETWRTINGVPVPPRPSEPENCCMSGCVHCVWDDYRDDVESWAMRLREAQAKGRNERNSKTTKGDSRMSEGGREGSMGTKQDGKIGFPRAEVNAASGSMDDDGGGSEALWQTPSTPSTSSQGDLDADALFQDIPIGIREFMATEKKIRERKRSKKLEVSAG